jgi:hypothetical protein
LVDDATTRESEFRFPVLQRILVTYFPGPGHDEDHSGEFIRRYQKLGESTIEFRGLKAELESAINNHPMVAAIEVNFALGGELADDEVRGHLISLYDQLNEEGEFDPQRTKAPRPEGAELLRSYFLVPVPLPQWLARRRWVPEAVPIGAVFVGGFLLLLLGTLGFRVVPGPLRPVTNIITVVALLTMGLSAWTMFGLRRAALRPEEEEETEGTAARPVAKPSRWRTWTRFRA